MGNIAYSYNFASAQVKRNLAAGSVVITWSTGGQPYTLTDDGAGNLTGDGTGTGSYSNGLIFINPNPAPAPSDGNYTIEYEDWQGTTKLNDTLTLAVGGQTTYTPATAMREGSIDIRLTVQRKIREWRYLETSGKPPRTDYTSDDIALTDDGAGNLRREKGGPIIGSINYATGAISFDARQSYSYKVYQEKTRIGGNAYFENDTATATETYSGSSAIIRWTDPADPVQIQSTTRPIPGLTIDLTPTSSRTIVPNSVLFDIAGTQYRDQDGAIIKGWSPITDTGT